MKKEEIATAYYEKIKNSSEVINVKKAQADYLISRISKTKIPRKGKLLDVACGTGVFGYVLGKKLNLKVYGADLSEKSLKESKKLGIETRKMDLDEKWQYKDSYFDVILSVQTLEHVYDPDNFINEAKRVLKQNGKLIINTPNLACWLNRMVFLFGYQPFFNEVSTKDKTLGLKFTRNMTPNRDTLGHVHVFTLKSLEDILELYGFKVEKKIGGEVNYFPWFIRIWDKFFSNFPGFATDLIIIASKK